MVGELIFSSFAEIASRERLGEWFLYQSTERKPLYYLLPSVKWFQAARKTQPGIQFQTFDDLATLLLNTRNIPFTPLSEDDRYMVFYEILNQSELLLSERELVQKAKAYADSYGQLKRLGLTVSQTPESIEELKKAFDTYEQEYRERRGLLDPESRILKAVEAPIPDFPLSHVVIDGFMDFSPVQYQFIDYLLRASVPLTIYLPALDTPIIHETATTLKTMGIQVPDEVPFLKIKCTKTSVTKATTIEEEIHGVLESIAQEKGAESYREFGIVLANERSYLPELERISNLRRIPLNRAKKKRLKETNFLPYLEQLLDKQENSTKWEQLPLVDTIAKLCFLPPTEFTKVKDSFILSGENSHDLISQLIEAANKFSAALPEKATTAVFIKRLLGFLENSSLPSIWTKIIRERIPTKLHLAALELRAYKRVLEKLAQSIDTKPVLAVSVHLETFRSKLLEILMGETLYLDRKPTDGIEIFSFRDVPLFKGRHLFVLGLNEGEFPKKINLSGYFQERYVANVHSPYPLPVPDYFRKKADAAFLQLPYLGETISFSYVEGMNPHQPLLPSKYLMEYKAEEVRYSSVSRFKDDTYLTIDEHEEKLAYQVGIGKEILTKSPVLAQFMKSLERLQTGEERLSEKWSEKLKSDRISITMLEGYAECSFKFAMDRVLKVQPPLEKQLAISPLETGNMLHRIIEAFYREAKGVPFQDLASFFEGQDEKKLALIFEKEWEIVKQKHLEIPMLNLEKEKQEWWKKLRRWLAAEKRCFWENEQLAEMAIYKMEELVRYTMILDNQEVITLSGKIDRIDIDEDGFVIYDYKSSDKELDFENKVPNGLMLQIPLYMIALNDQFKQGKEPEHLNKGAVGGGYISIKKPHHRKKNTVWKDEEEKHRFEPKEKTNIVRLESESLLQEFQFPMLIERLWRGSYTDFSVKPFSADSCRYCIFKAICRVRKEQLDS